MTAILKASEFLRWPQMVSNIKFDCTFEICNVHNPFIHVHIAYNSLFGGPWHHGSLKTASMTSEVKYYLWL